MTFLLMLPNFNPLRRLGVFFCSLLFEISRPPLLGLVRRLGVFFVAFYSRFHGRHYLALLTSGTRPSNDGREISNKRLQKNTSNHHKGLKFGNLSKKVIFYTKMEKDGK